MKKLFFPGSNEITIKNLNKMPKDQTYVVLDPATGLYYTGQIGLGNASQPTFGTLENAVEYDSQGEANAAAASIGGGTIGTTKPR